jgi:sulfur-oxidizing protein SoxY
MFRMISRPAHWGGGVVLALACAMSTACLAQTSEATGGDPFGSFQWPDLKREFLGHGPVEFDARVQVRGPAFAEDPMNVPITVSADSLGDVLVITVLVDRNPIRKVLEYFPLGSLPRVSFRFKLEQASPVRAAVKTRDGVWHVGGVLVDSAGGGCTATGQTRRDGSWSRSLGELSARVFPHSAPAGSGAADAATRLRLRVMHPMDTGLVDGIPAFYVNHLSLRDADGRELMRLNSFEPVSENPVFSFDFADQPTGPLRLVGSDNNGNRIDGAVE